MTRVNLVAPTQLADQHLFAEWRELKMVPKSLNRSLAAMPPEEVLQGVPEYYRLGTGHVRFFYNKGAFLQDRFNLLTAELVRRGVHDFDRTATLDGSGVYAELHRQGWGKLFWRHYVPSVPEVLASRARIRDRLRQKPQWYRYEGRPILPDSEFSDYWRL